MRYSNLFSIALVLALVHQSSSLICYSCGYLEAVNGTKLPLDEEKYGIVPFCNDFVSSEDNTVMAGLVSVYLKVLSYDNLSRRMSKAEV